MDGAASRSPRPTFVVERQMSLEQSFELASRGYLWALIDACDTRAVPEKLRAMGKDRVLSLLPEDYWAISPYLVKMDSALLEWLKQTVWESPWGIFAVSKDSMQDLYAHFCSQLNKTLPDNNRWYFRYYDPRVLEKYLYSHKREEVSALFGPVLCYGVGMGREPGWKGFMLK